MSDRNLLLSDRNWKAFSVEDIFKKIKRGRRFVLSAQKKGEYPYISSRSSNNGIDSFTLPTSKNVLFSQSVGINNSGSVGIAFFHPYKAIFSDHVTTCISPAIKNRYIGLFLVTALENGSKNRYSFNYEMNDYRLKRSKILLPVDSNGKPDYDFMENYMRQVETDLDLTLLNSVSNLQFEENPHQINLDKIRWESYIIGDVFNVASSPYSLDYNALPDSVKSSKQVPYVTRTSKSNGISSFIKDMSDNGQAPIPGNCITVGLDTATVNYQSLPFYSGQNIHILRNDNLNKHNAIFLIPLLEKSLEKFGWGGFSATLGRFRKNKILLPANIAGNIYWALMEEYIRSIRSSNFL